MQLSSEDQPQENNDLEVRSSSCVYEYDRVGLIQNMQPSSDAQEDWEDLSDAEEGSQREVIVTSSTNTSQTASTVSQRKKRRAQTKTPSPASPTTSRSRSIKGHRKAPIVQKEPKLQEAIAHGARFTASYAFDVLKGSIEKMRKPLSWFLFIWMFAWLISRTTPAIRMAFSPLCIIPGISRSTLCVPVPSLPSVNFEKLANIQGSTFEQLVGESAGNSQLSIEVLRAEMATQDLSLLVRYSDLKSKENIADMLRTIGTDAKKTGRGLSKLNAKVVGAIDECVLELVCFWPLGINPLTVM